MPGCAVGSQNPALNEAIERRGAESGELHHIPETVKALPSSLRVGIFVLGRFSGPLVFWHFV